MLNELKQLTDSVEKAAIKTYLWDNKLQPLRKGVGYVVMLSETGGIKEIRDLTQESMEKLRTWTGGANGESFPCFNLDLSEKYENATARRDLEKRKAIKCLTTIAKDFTRKMGAMPEGPQSLFSLLSTIEKMTPESAGSLLEELVLQLGNKTYPKSNGKTLLQKGKKNKESEYFAKPISLFFDGNRAGDGWPVPHEETMKWINERLLASQKIGEKPKSVKDKAHVLRVDAFGTEMEATMDDEVFPVVTLSLGKTPLRAMNKEAQCQTRYGKIGSASYPASSSTRNNAKMALEWISRPERKNKTWGFVGSSELLFAYPKVLPNEPPLLAMMFTGGDSNSDERFADCAERVFSSLHAIQNKENEAEIELFAIKKADTARRKVVYYRNYNIETIVAATDKWRVGAENLPPMIMSRWGKEKGKTEYIQFKTPFPLKIITTVYIAWSLDLKQDPETQSNRSVLKSKEPPHFNGLELFFAQSGDCPLAGYLMQMIIQNGFAAFMTAGNAIHSHKIIQNTLASYLESSLPIVAILLHKQGINKESYMNSPPYLIGKLLKLADELHALYCKEVRTSKNGEDKANEALPPQLIGNSFFALASNNPTQAVSALGDRLRPYLAWARTNSSGSAGLSRWLLAEFTKIADALHQAALPNRLNDNDKAQLFLGYLSSTKGKEQKPEGEEV